MAEVTVLCVTQNNLDLLRLTVESFRRYNSGTPFLFWLWDNASTDGAREWAERNCDRVFHKDGPLGHHHAEPLDRMVREVATPWVMTLDNDVLSTGPVLGRMVGELRATGAFAAGPPARYGMGTVDHFGRRLEGQQRVDPCCAVFDAPRLARLGEKVSFAPYELTNLGKFYDTGGMIRHAAEGAGMAVLDLPWVWDAVTHFGSMTLGYNARPNAPPREEYERRMVTVREHAGRLDADLLAGTEVVLARYNEPLGWVADLTRLDPTAGRVTVYSKGAAGPGSAALPNVGREAHTYAAHVAGRYADLAEVTVFAQANPFDHVPDFLDQVRVPTCRFRAFGPHRLVAGPAGDACHAGLPVAETYKELTGRDFPGAAEFSPGACFAAHRDALRAYPAAWWRRLADRLASPETQGWMPWVMERLWQSLLTLPPVPHFYHTIAGWFGAEDLYRDAVRSALDGAHFVEVGSWVGRSSSFMAVEIANSHKRIRFDAVDHFRGSSSPGEEFMRREAARHGGTMRGVFDRNLKPAAAYVSVVEMESTAAAATYPDGSIDFVYLDGGHSEGEVAADVAAWLPKVRPGGAIGGDDYSYAWPGVIAAVDAAFGPGCRYDARNWLYRVPPE